MSVQLLLFGGATSERCAFCEGIGWAWWSSSLCGHCEGTGYELAPLDVEALRRTPGLEALQDGQGRRGGRDGR